MNYRLLNFQTVKIGENYALLSPEWGTCFVCDTPLYDRIVSGLIDDDLALKLFQSHLLILEDIPARGKPTTRKEIKPTFFLIDVSQNCNLACTYCFRDLNGSIIEEGVLNDILEFIYSYYRSNNLHQRISIQPWGGEPLIAMDRIAAIYRYFHDRPDVDCKISIESNGTLITPEVAHDLRYMKCGLGISLDGIPYSHNQNRVFKNGEGSFSRVKHGLDCLLGAGYKMDEIGTVLTLTKHNLLFLEEIIDFYHESLNITKFKLNYAFRNYNVRIKDQAALLSPEEFAQAQIITCEKIFAMLLSGKPISESNILQKGRNILYRNRGDVCKSQGCQGGYRMIAFDSMGNIYPCNLTDFPETSIGSIYQNSDLLDQINSCIAIGHPYFQEKESDRCLSCAWKYFCRGGCRTTTYYSRAKFEIVDEYECTSNKILYPYLMGKFLDQPELIRYFERDID